MGNKIKSIHIYFAIDISGSMNGEKIEKVNNFMEVVISECKNIYDGRVPLVGHVLTFGDGVRWIIGNSTNGVLISDLVWNNLDAKEKRTETAKAVHHICKGIQEVNKTEDCASSIIILLTDGKCTEPSEVYKNAVNALKSVNKNNDLRIAVRIDGADERELDYFAGDISNQKLIFGLRDNEQICNYINLLYKLLSSNGTSVNKMDDWVG